VTRADFQQAITVEPLGDLRMPSGRIVVCDPMWLGTPDLPVLAEQVEPDKYAVSAVKLTTAFSDNPESTWSEIAALRVSFRAAEPVAWEYARLADRDPEAFFRYPVDTGLACIVDAAASDALSEGVAFNDLGDACGDWSAIPAVVTDPGTGQAVAVSTSGAGDGFYPIWLGRDADGQVGCVVTTFLHDSIKGTGSQ